MKSGYNGCMEWFEFMSAADGRKRELANFEIDQKAAAKPKKKGSASSAARSAGKSASGVKKASVSAKPASPVKKASASAKTSASAKKTASSGEKKGAAAAKKASTGMKAASAASPKSADTAKKKAASAKQLRVEENPLARRDSAVRTSAAQAKPRSKAYEAYDEMDLIAPKQTAPRKKASAKAHEPYDDMDLIAPKQAKPRKKAPAKAYEAYDEFDGPKKKARPKAAEQKFDAWDDFDEAPRPEKKKRRKKNRSPFSSLTLLLIFLICGFVGLGAWRVSEYKEFTRMKAVVSRQTFYDGTTVEGVDVSSMTLSDALAHWESQIEPAYRETAAVLNDGTRVTAAQMGYSSDYVHTLSSAWNAGRTGTMVERYRRAAMHMAQPRAYDVARSLYDEEVVRSYAAQLAEQIDTQPRSAHLESFDPQTLSFTFAREQVGRTLDQQKLAQDIKTALSAGGGNVQMEIAAIAPEVSYENVASQYGMITTAVTNASSSTRNRLNNIALALQIIDGTCLEPGQTFSFNDVVGERTRDRGFKSAPAYSRGEVTEEVGGGICQVSTTLFNAAVKSDMEIKERYNHSMTVSYVDPGKDAAVDWGNKDLKFTNTSDDNVYLSCYLSEDERVHISVYGKLLEDGKTITLEGKKTDTIDPETEYRVNFAMASGETKLVQKGKKGYSATSYKIWWDANGNEIEREQLCKSRYNAANEIIEYGP